MVANPDVVECCVAELQERDGGDGEGGFVPTGSWGSKGLPKGHYHCRHGMWWNELATGPAYGGLDHLGANTHTRDSTAAVGGVGDRVRRYPLTYR